MAQTVLVRQIHGQMQGRDAVGNQADDRAAGAGRGRGEDRWIDAVKLDGISPD